MGKEWEFNQDWHEQTKRQFERICSDYCEYLKARRYLDHDSVPRPADDAIFVAASQLARLLDGHSVERAKKILTEASRQIDMAHKVSAASLHSLLTGE